VLDDLITKEQREPYVCLLLVQNIRTLRQDNADFRLTMGYEIGLASESAVTPNGAQIKRI
jgi:tRNA U34 5-carboxymethylaminomethyl modifying enzyme MnmG/GidA